MSEPICDNDMIEKMVEETRKEIEKFFHGLASDTSDAERQCLLLHGVGMSLPMAIKELEEDGFTIPYIIDDTESLWGTFQNGIEVVSRNDERIHEFHYIIATTYRVKELFQTYENNMMKRKIISYGQYHLCKHYNEYIEARSYLEDTKSVLVFNLAMKSQLTSYFEGEMWRVCEDNQYFALPEFGLLRGECIVDAGAYVGDTLEEFCRHSITMFEHYYAFEPGVKQFAALKKRVQRICEEWALDEQVFTLVRAGVGDKNDEIISSKELQSYKGNGFRLKAGIKDPAGERIPVYSLDSFLGDKKVTLIKADIEGMEMDLLVGAREIIRTQKPKLAISIYHLPCDLYSIMNKIRDINPEYRFIIRSHSMQYGEIVLYCF